ncbi:MAG: aminodeoxychorismate/anthranilate synthase component II [Bacteroidetes bacterium]|nr:aminodeoxychorismate/anthranilate synthase component II [Bacteroidota bacterium]
MKLLLIDNYDSFTYNLEHYFTALNCEVLVMRNQEISIEEIAPFDAIVLSPGPGLPKDAGICMAIIEKFHALKPILGICLGAQALAESFGGALYNQDEVAHGISRKVSRTGPSWLLNGMDSSFSVGLYHSWAIETSDEFTNHFKAIAFRENGVLMAFESSNYALAGLQFHPESIMTEGGKLMLSNWIIRAQRQIES